MSGVEITVRVLRDGGRRVVVTVPVDQCVSGALTMGDPAVVADSIAMEVAMHALQDALEGDNRD